MSLFDPNFLAGLEYLALVARRRQSGAQPGSTAGRRLGDGLEFADHREYAPGDELRHVDWPAYGRLGRLFVRLFHQHTDQIVHVLLDCSASMRTGAGEAAIADGLGHARAERPTGPVVSASKFDFARRVAAAMAYLALNNLDRAALAEIRGGAFRSGPVTARGRDQIFGLMRHLESLTADGTAGLVAALCAFAERTREPGTVVVVSDFLDDQSPEPALDALRGRSHDVLGIQVLAPSEVDPTAAADFRGRLRLTDAETGAVASVPLTRSLVEAYIQEARTCFAALSTAFGSRQAALVRVTTDVPLERFLLELIRRGLAAGG